jgi:hypothetical protein
MLSTKGPQPSNIQTCGPFSPAYTTPYQRGLVSQYPFGHVGHLLCQVRVPNAYSLDSSGGNQLNLDLDLGRTPGIWMMSEAINSGAFLKPKKVEWDWQNLDVVKESLTGVWHLTKQNTRTWPLSRLSRRSRFLLL